MDKQRLSVVLISDFNIDVLAGYLSNLPESPTINAVATPFGAVVPAILGATARECIMVWTRPESVIAEFAKAMSFQEFSLEEALRQVDDYATLLLGLRGKAASVFVPAWVIPTYFRGYGLIDWKEGLGLTNLLAQMNLRLAHHLSTAAGFYMLNTAKWIESTGKDAFSEKLMYMAKVPFTPTVFKLAAQDIKAALRALTGGAKKLVIVDLDDTLWPGLVGNEGWQNLNLGGHDPVGEAFVGFQQALKALTRRGILLGIVSKNDEKVALEAIDRHPAMVLKRDDFAGWRINWDDKAKNIADLANELNLGLQSVVFIDDSPFERTRVKDALPEVFVVPWPEDKTLAAQTLLNLSCFDVPAFSAEDAKRTTMVQAERLRQQSKIEVGSLDAWLASLGMTVKVEELNDANIVRATQLLNKTNQMNLSTRRLGEAELRAWAQHAGHKMWAFTVSDKIGDSGLTGLISLDVNSKPARLVDMVLSCRVFGRRIEECMVYTALAHAKSLGLTTIEAEYVPTPKNTPCLDFLERSGFERQGHVFRWPLEKEYKSPEHITVK